MVRKLCVSLSHSFRGTTLKYTDCRLNDLVELCWKQVLRNTIFDECLKSTIAKLSLIRLSSKCSCLSLKVCCMNITKIWHGVTRLAWCPKLSMHSLHDTEPSFFTFRSMFCQVCCLYQARLFSGTATSVFSVSGTFRSVKFSARKCQLPHAVSGWCCFQVLPNFSGFLNNLQQNTIQRVLSFTMFAFSITAPINAFFSGICKRLPFAIRSRPVDMFPSSIDALAETLFSAHHA